MPFDPKIWEKAPPAESPEYLDWSAEKMLEVSDSQGSAAAGEFLRESGARRQRAKEAALSLSDSPPEPDSPPQANEESLRKALAYAVGILTDIRGSTFSGCGDCTMNRGRVKAARQFIEELAGGDSGFGLSPKVLAVLAERRMALTDALVRELEAERKK